MVSCLSLLNKHTLCIYICTSYLYGTARLATILALAVRGGSVIHPLQTNIFYVFVWYQISPLNCTARHNSRLTYEWLATNLALPV